MRFRASLYPKRRWLLEEGLVLKIATRAAGAGHTTLQAKEAH